MFVAVGLSVFQFDEFLGFFDHHATKGRSRRGDREAGELADLGTGEAVHRVGRDLQSELTTIQYSPFKRVSRLSEFDFGFLTSRDQFFKDQRQYALLDVWLDEPVIVRRLSDCLWVHFDGDMCRYKR